MSQALTDIQIARQATPRPIQEIASRLSIPEADLWPCGRSIAKVSLEFCRRVEDRPLGKLVLVTAMTPTPAGEGKTTTTVGLGDALNRIGKRATICLREPSLGPCFGMKGGAAGGGYAQVIPMEAINLHFTGDFHAITAAHNLLAAMIDNHLHHGSDVGLDPRRVHWKRVLDMNDRALRQVVVGLGGPANSFPRETGFDITVASEVMAVFCLCESLHELRQRLSRMIVAHTADHQPITVGDLKAHGAMTALLRDALAPNLVQSLEHNPAFVHGGPFANIAHGCNSVMATKLALRLSEYVVTEAGFGADLGGEKFLDIKCRQSGLRPDVAVVVATIRALKHHGGQEAEKLKDPNPAAVEAGVPNLERHIENLHRFGLPVVVAVNTFTSDTAEEFEVVRRACDHLGVKVVKAEHWARGSAGAEDLAHAVVEATQNEPARFKPLYDDDMALLQKVRTIAQVIYGANDILADKKLRLKFKQLEESGYRRLPICMAKTQYSFSTDPLLRGAPRNFDVPLRDAGVSAGAGFVVVYAGDILTMPGLPKQPAAETIDIDDRGQIVGLF